MNWYRKSACVFICMARLNTKWHWYPYRLQKWSLLYSISSNNSTTQNMRLWWWGLVGVLLMFQSNVNEPNYFYVCRFAGLSRLTHPYTARIYRYWTLATCITAPTMQTKSKHRMKSKKKEEKPSPTLSQ